MAQGNQLTEGQLKALPTGSKVYITYDHPDPTENHYHGPATVERNKGGCWLNISKIGCFEFSMDFEYTGDDDALCTSDGGDGDVLEIFEWVPGRKRKGKGDKP